MTKYWISSETSVDIDDAEDNNVVHFSVDDKTSLSQPGRRFSKHCSESPESVTSRLSVTIPPSGLTVPVVSVPSR